MVHFGKIIPYDINITPSSNNGFIVQCGCSTNVFTDKESLLNAIREYISNPIEMEKQYCAANKLNYCNYESMNSLQTRPPINSYSEECKPDTGR